MLQIVVGMIVPLLAALVPVLGGAQTDLANERGLQLAKEMASRAFSAALELDAAVDINWHLEVEELRVVPCLGDLDGDDDTDQSDLGILLAAYDVDDGDGAIDLSAFRDDECVVILCSEDAARIEEFDRLKYRVSLASGPVLCKKLLVSFSLPVFAFLTQSGSARKGLAMETMSLQPSARTFSATSGILILLVATSGISTSPISR